MEDKKEFSGPPKGRLKVGGVVIEEADQFHPPSESIPARHHAQAIVSTKSAAFGTSAERFIPNVGNAVPGPSDYETQHSAKRWSQGSVSKKGSAAFAPQFTKAVAYYTGPSSGDYSYSGLDMSHTAGLKPAAVSVFRSGSKRMPQSSLSLVPGPGAYDPIVLEGAGAATSAFKNSGREGSLLKKAADAAAAREPLPPLVPVGTSLQPTPMHAPFRSRTKREGAIDKNKAEFPPAKQGQLLSAAVSRPGHAPVVVDDLLPPRPGQLRQRPISTLPPRAVGSITTQPKAPSVVFSAAFALTTTDRFGAPTVHYADHGDPGAVGPGSYSGEFIPVQAASATSAWAKSFSPRFPAARRFAPPGPAYYSPKK